MDRDLSVWKVMFYCLAGLAVPFVLIIFFGPWILGSLDSKKFSSTDNRLQQNVAEDSVSDAPSDPSLSYAVISSDPALDPQESSTFLVSISFRFSELPPVGTKQKIVSKYDAKTSPYPGWAIAISRARTSTRPALYWKTLEGKGDWLFFDDLMIEPGQNYVLTIVVNPHHSILAFGGALASSETRLRFLGGYDLNLPQVPNSNANLYFGARGVQQSFFRGDVIELLVANGFDWPKKNDKLRNLFESAPEGLRKQISEDQISLYVSGKGEDESKYHRQILFRDS